MRILSLMALLALSACAADRQGFVWQDRTSATQAYIDDQPVWVIGCEANLSNCHEKAAEVCPAGYNIVEEGTIGAGPGRTKHALMMQLKASCR